MPVRKPSETKNEAATPTKSAPAKSANRHGEGTNQPSKDTSGKYQFVVGASVQMLEIQVNQMVGNHHQLALKQVFFATGTGFVAVLERE